MADRRLCVLNAGSSSLKSGGCTTDDGLLLAQRGEVDRIGGSARMKVTGAGRRCTRALLPRPSMRGPDALARLPDGPLEAVGLIGFGHRVVHGGPTRTAPGHNSRRAARQ